MLGESQGDTTRDCEKDMKRGTHAGGMLLPGGVLGSAHAGGALGSVHASGVLGSIHDVSLPLSST